jgi:hypothetical protein
MLTDVPGAVSLWVGVSPSQDALWDYVEMDYSSADVLSQFARDFGTGHYDHDFMDAFAREKATHSLAELLRGCSQDSVIIPKFIELCGEVLPIEANAAVVLYDFRHYELPRPKPSWDSAIKLRYMGSITVPTPWPN